MLTRKDREVDGATSDIVGAHVRGTETGLCVLWKAGWQSCKFIEHEAFWRNFMVLSNTKVSLRMSFVMVSFLHL